jgi:hypothetical protein
MQKIVSSLLALTVTLALTQACSSTSRDSGFEGIKEDAGAKTDTGPEKGPSIGTETDAATNADVNSDPLAGCAIIEGGTIRSPAFFQLVADRSGSMSGDKWAAAQLAMRALVDQLATEKDTTVGLGLILYPGDGAETGPYPDPNGKDPFINFVDATQKSALNARIGVAVKGSTPTYEAMLGGYTVLENLNPLPPLPKEGKKVLIIMTDGEPNDNASNKIQKMTAQKLAMAAPKGPIQTFVVGIEEPGGGFSGGELFQFLGDLAIKGGTQSSPTCDPNEENTIANMCHYHIDPGGGKTKDQIAAELTTAFNRIRAQASACELSLATDDAKADPSKVNVVFEDSKGNKTIIPKDGTNGWTYDNDANPTKVLLHGKACEDAVKDFEGKVKVALGCKGGAN